MDNIDRVERLLALILLQSMEGASKREKILKLNLAGFSNVEIADLIQTTTAVISQTIYEGKKSRNKSQETPKKVSNKNA